MSRPSMRIEVQQEAEGGWSVARDRIVDGHFNDLVAANDYASACAQRAQRAGMVVRLSTVPSGPSTDADAES